MQNYVLVLLKLNDNIYFHLLNDLYMFACSQKYTKLNRLIKILHVQQITPKHLYDETKQIIAKTN